MPRPGPRKIEKPKNPIKTFKKIFTFVGKYKWYTVEEQTYKPMI